jgi:hypothetical protein
VLSHRSAAALWGVLTPGFVDVTVRGQNRPLRGVRFHRARLPGDEVTGVHGIPVTTVPRTLMDLAAILRLSQLERAINEAEVQRLRDPLSLPDLLERYPRRPGTRAIKTVLRKLESGANLPHSELEHRFRAFIAEWRLPPPEVNAWLQIEGEWLECDCVWHVKRLVVELDGRATHGTAAAFERDRAPGPAPARRGLANGPDHVASVASGRRGARRGSASGPRPPIPIRGCSKKSPRERLAGAHAGFRSSL